MKNSKFKFGCKKLLKQEQIELGHAKVLLSLTGVRYAFALDAKQGKRI